MRRSNLAAVLCLALMILPFNHLLGKPPASNSALTPATQPNANGITEHMQQAVLAWLDWADAHVDQLTPAAEVTADQLLRGGHMWACGNGGFSDEMFFRIGGLPFMHVWPSDPDLRTHQAPHDVFMYGQLIPNESEESHDRLSTLMISGRYGNAKVVLVASAQWPQVSHLMQAMPPERIKDRVYLIDTHAPQGDSIEDQCVSEIAAVAMAWAYQGEVVSAATRKGKTLATYASPYEKDPKQTDDSVANLIVNPAYNLKPIPAGQVAHAYLKCLREQIAPFADSQAGNVRAAAARIAQLAHDGGLVWSFNNGHLHQRGSAIPADLPILNEGRGFEWKWIAPRAPKQDLVFALGSVKFPDNIVQPALDRGMPVIAVSAEDRQSTPEVMHIRCFIGPLDSCVDLPDYPIKILPTSGVVQALVWHSVMAETEQIVHGR